MMKDIELPGPDYRGLIFEDALLKRRSIREYARLPLTLEEVSQILFASYGVTDEKAYYKFKTVPSAGACYPIDIYFVANNVSNLTNGLYMYKPEEHSVLLIKEGKFVNDFKNACWGQNMVSECALAILITATFKRITSRYSERGIRYTHFEAGHICQNIQLQAVSLNLGSVAIGAYDDKAINNLFGFDGKETSVIYIAAIGKLLQ